jgi:hypothetical protein
MASGEDTMAVRWRRILWRLELWALRRQLRLRKLLLADLSAEGAALVVQEDREDRLNNQETLHTAVGQALASWASAEEHIVMIAAMLLSIPDEKAGLIFYSIINFNTWLAIVNDLFRADPRFQGLMGEWNKISSRLRGLKNLRDRLAHHGVHAEQSDVVLGPMRYDTRTQSRQHRPLNNAQVIEFTSKTNDMAERLKSLILKMMPIFRQIASEGKSSE